MSDLQKYLTIQKEKSPTFAANYERIKSQSRAEMAFSEILLANDIDCKEFCRIFDITPHEFNVLAHFVYGVNDEEPPLKVLRQVLRSAARRMEKGVKNKLSAEEGILLAFEANEDSSPDFPTPAHK